MDWQPEPGYYRSSGITAAPAAYCHDASGGRIPDSYEVEQTLSLVPSQASPSEAGQAADMLGRRVDVGRPVAGMPATCGTFTELWSIRATRPND
jgi:hypothetical protein